MSGYKNSLLYFQKPEREQNMKARHLRVNGALRHRRPVGEKIKGRREEGWEDSYTLRACSEQPGLLPGKLELY